MRFLQNSKMIKTLLGFTYLINTALEKFYAVKRHFNVQVFTLTD